MPRLARLDASGRAYFYHSDGNGNVVAMTKARGQVVNAYLYAPFVK